MEQPAPGTRKLSAADFPVPPTGTVAGIASRFTGLSTPQPEAEFLAGYEESRAVGKQKAGEAQAIRHAYRGKVSSPFYCDIPICQGEIATWVGRRARHISAT